MSTQTIDRRGEFETENESPRSRAGQDEVLSGRDRLFPRTATPDLMDPSPAVAVCPEPAGSGRGRVCWSHQCPWLGRPRNTRPPRRFAQGAS